MNRSLVLLGDTQTFLAYCYLWDVEVGKPIKVSCGYLVFETVPEVRDKLLAEMGAIVI